MDAKMESNRERDRDNLKEIKAEMNAKMDGQQEEMLARMREDIKTSEAEMRCTICAFLSELEETIQEEKKNFLSYVEQKTQNLRSELTEAIEKEQIVLQRVEVSLDKLTRGIEKNMVSIKEDITSNNRKFQSEMDEIKAVAEGGSRPTFGTNAAQLQTFNGNTTWSPFRRQAEIVAENNQWSDREKFTYLITAFKGREADVLPGIPTNSTYEDTIQTLEDRFGDQHFVDAYSSRLSRIQKAGDTLQNFITAIDLLAHRACPTLPKDNIGREAGKISHTWYKTPI
jgi:DNA repair exonuclease SbcCD ATPase subunit